MPECPPPPRLPRKPNPKKKEFSTRALGNDVLLSEKDRNLCILFPKKICSEPTKTEPFRDMISDGLAQGLKRNLTLPRTSIEADGAHQISPSRPSSLTARFSTSCRSPSSCVNSYRLDSSLSKARSLLARSVSRFGVARTASLA